jgi:DNA-directed RNA polymerase subunit alpha
VRAYNVIVKDHANDFYTLKDIVSLEKNELLRYRNMGKKSVNAIEEFLDELGLSFGMDISKMEREYADSIVNSEEVPAA